MNRIQKNFPQWEDLIKDIIEEDGFSPIILQNTAFNEEWILNNQFYYGKNGKRTDNWVFTFYRDVSPTERFVEELNGYSTLEDALEAKIFDGESIHDLYNRGYDWLRDYTKEEIEKEKKRRGKYYKKYYLDLYEKRKKRRLEMEKRGDIWWLKKTRKEDLKKEKELLNPKKWELWWVDENGNNKEKR